MQRDFAAFEKWKQVNYDMQQEQFGARKALAIKNASAQDNAQLLEIAKDMMFQFDASGLLHYGNCLKFKNPVCFIPMTCQLETQDCFVHRKNIQL